MATGILEFRSFSVTSNLGDLCWSSNFRKIVIIADGSGYEIICCAYSIESLTRCVFAELLASTFQQNRGQTSIRILIPESIQSSSMVTIKPHIQIFMGSKSWNQLIACLLSKYRFLTTNKRREQRSGQDGSDYTDEWITLNDLQ